MLFFVTSDCPIFVWALSQPKPLLENTAQCSSAVTVCDRPVRVTIPHPCPWPGAVTCAHLTTSSSEPLVQKWPNPSLCCPALGLHKSNDLRFCRTHWSRILLSFSSRRSEVYRNKTLGSQENLTKDRMYWLKAAAYN